MNICFVTSEYASPLRGGVERVTCLLAAALAKGGFGVYMVSQMNPLTEEERQENRLVFPSANEEVNAGYLEDLLREHQISVVINQSHHLWIFRVCAEVKKRTGCKLLTVVHTAPDALLRDLTDRWEGSAFQAKGHLRRIRAFVKEGVLYPYRYRVLRRLLHDKYAAYYGMSDAVVLLSHRYKVGFSRLGELQEASRLYAISNPVEFVNGDWDFSSKQKVLLYVGRMEFSAKRPDRVVKIWEKLHHQYPDWHLYMLGDGPAKACLMDYCTQKGIGNIHFTGVQNPIPYYNKASILCFTSTHEGFGLVLIEAMSKGVIPIAYNSYEAVQDIIKDKTNGFLIPPFKESKYIRTLKSLMDNEDLRRQVMEETVRGGYLQRNTLDEICKEWIGLIHRI